MTERKPLDHPFVRDYLYKTNPCRMTKGQLEDCKKVAELIKKARKKYNLKGVIPEPIQFTVGKYKPDPNVKLTFHLDTTKTFGRKGGFRG